MVEPCWTVHVWAPGVPEPRARAAGLEGLASSFEGVSEGAPFLLSPSWEYDVVLRDVRFGDGPALVGVDDVLQDPCHWGGEVGDLVGGDGLDGDDLQVVAPGCGMRRRRISGWSWRASPRHGEPDRWRAVSVGGTGEPPPVTGPGHARWGRAPPGGQRVSPRACRDSWDTPLRRHDLDSDDGNARTTAAPARVAQRTRGAV